MTNNLYPTIDIIIPTLNAQIPLQKCLHSIKKQIYPKNKINIIIADGGSIDKTLEIAKKYKAKIIFNKLKTAEAGKAIAIKNSSGQLIALIDSDNILPTKNWLKKMVFPFNDKQIIGSEPYKFTYRKEAGMIEKYSALIGANDPYAFVTNVYDRYSYITKKWTGLKLEIQSNNNFYKIKFSPNSQIPTIGANGTFFKRDFIQQNFNSDYFFDIDIITSILNKTKKPIYFAKVKTGIIHTYCENSIKKFIKKQNRRVVDFYTYKNLRTYKWDLASNNSQKKFFIYTIFIIPSIIDTIKGFINKPSIIWLFHPLFCQITLLIYSINFLKNKFGILKAINRENWTQ